MKKPTTPDRDTKYMLEQHGTACLITDSRADRYLERARKERMAKLKERKTIMDAWTI